jgi:phage portal protein BeeE
MADLSRKIGSAFGRLQAEMVQPVLQRVIYLLTKQGRIEIPTVNGRQVKIKSVSPLAQAQSNQDIVSLDRFLEMVAGRFGPEVINLLVSSEETAIYLAKKFGVPDQLIRDVGERQRMVQMAQQMQQQTGIDPNANPNIQALGG